jgi:hypothetical protein
VECWQPIVSASGRGLNFMVRHGIKGIIGRGTVDGDALVGAPRSPPATTDASG